MKKREIKKTIVHYSDQTDNKTERERSRSRQKPSKQIQTVVEVKVQSMNVQNRKERLERIRKAREQQQKQLLNQSNFVQEEMQIKIEEPIIIQTLEQPIINQVPSTQFKSTKKQYQKSDEEQEDEQEPSTKRVLMKPVFIARQYREDEQADEEKGREEERKKRNNRYTTKLLLEQSKYQDSEEENQNTDSDQENQTNIPDDNDLINEQYQFQLWKIRELKRIRAAQEERRKHEIEKAELDRRRIMTNQQILIQNRALGSDSTDHDTQTKYVFLQKYYHRGAFYQDTDDPVFQRDYNLPTPMEMQDKSMLPSILQKRIGNFGKKGQSKYTHLTAQDTTDTNPLTRADQSLLQSWKRKTAGYKGSYGSNV